MIYDKVINMTDRYKKESDWINELVKTHRNERERSTQPSRTPSPSGRNTTAPPTPNPNQHAAADDSDSRPIVHNTHANGRETITRRNRTSSGQSTTSCPTLAVQTSAKPLHPDIAECVDAALRASAAVDDIENEHHDSSTHLGPHHSNQRIPHHRRQQSGMSKWSQALPRVMEIAARRRTAINGVINEFRRLKQLRREMELYDPLLEELTELDAQLRDIIRAIEPDLPFSRRPSALTPVASSQGNRNANGNVEVWRPTEELVLDAEALGLAAIRTPHSRFRALLGFDDSGTWTWGARSRIAVKWLRVRNRALELTARRAALGNRVLFAVLIMISARLADQESRDERQAELIRELVEMRREWEDGSGGGGVTPT